MSSVSDVTKRPLGASFRDAIRGWETVLLERNMRIHLIAAAVVLGLAWNLQVAAWQWGVLLLSISSVIVAEMLNTAVEYIVDLASPDYSELARAAKDIAAGAVLFAALGAVAIANLVFAPHLTGLLPGLWQAVKALPAVYTVLSAALGFGLLWGTRPLTLATTLAAAAGQLWLLHRYPDVRLASALVVVSFLVGVSGKAGRPFRFYMGVLFILLPISRLIILGG